MFFLSSVLFSHEKNTCSEIVKNLIFYQSILCSCSNAVEWESIRFFDNAEFGSSSNDSGSATATRKVALYRSQLDIPHSGTTNLATAVIAVGIAINKWFSLKGKKIARLSFFQMNFLLFHPICGHRPPPPPRQYRPRGEEGEATLTCGL